MILLSVLILIKELPILLESDREVINCLLRALVVEISFPEIEVGLDEVALVHPVSENKNLTILLCKKH